MRKQGILMPISSLPSAYGIGTFGRESYAFVDFLKAAGQRLWQILPLGPTGYGASPYQSFSTFAGNPYFIDLELLVQDGYLTKKECDAVDFGSDPQEVDYGKLYSGRFPLLRKAWERAVRAGLETKAAYVEFIKENAFWLDDYAMFMALKDAFPGTGLLDWEEDLRLRKPLTMAKYQRQLADEIKCYKFQQYVFQKQWTQLKLYANRAGIEIIGDIPIYVSMDSADVWAHPELFLLDESGSPIGVAGCPPDAFSETGQLWGNPLYRWEFHKITNYNWWYQRINHCYNLYDIVRLDHFRGFDEYWFVPYGDKTAAGGHWEKGPGAEMFEILTRKMADKSNKGTGRRGKLADKKVIAEDLGFMTEGVFRLLAETGYPGMKVLQFAFDEGPDGEGLYLPHNYTKNCVVYTGTHDNETTLGWIRGRSAKQNAFLKEYLNADGETELLWEMIRAAVSSVADTAVIPMQDYLELGNEARMNFPATMGANWKWRMLPGAATPKLAEKIYRLARTYGRLREN
ncbi:MAG: 4-alpha-glucanotransferase [Lachnospiraceae bacterium]|nr:4-alpha-glucanotransferase [Lachnospiraceae bacterium]